MLGWSINLFRIFGIQLSVHASFVLLLAYSGWEGWQEGGRWLGMLLSILVTVLFFICVVLHELGHSLTALRYGVRVPRILLMPIGGMAEFDRIPRQPAAELIITINGPLVNFVIVLVLWTLVGLPGGTLFNPQFAEPELKGLGQLLLYLNAFMGVFNLLPVFPMDGGRIFRALLATRLPYLQATFWAAKTGQVLAVLLATTALYFKWWMPAVLFSFIFIVGEAEYKLLKRREQEEAYRVELAKQVILSGMSRSADEPPAPPQLIIHGPN